MDDPMYQLNPRHPANVGKVSLYPTQSADDDRDKVLDKSGGASRQGQLRVEDHGPQLPEPEPAAPSRPMWTGTRPDLMGLAEDDEAGRLTPGILPPRQGETAKRLRELRLRELGSGS
jgi:hypothetical protein